LNKRTAPTVAAVVLIVACCLLSACAGIWYRHADRGHCTNPRVCRHQELYENGTFPEIERIFLESDARVRAELLVFGFDHMHHRPHYLLDTLNRLPIAEQREVAEILLDLATTELLRDAAAAVPSEKSRGTPDPAGAER